MLQSAECGAAVVPGLYACLPKDDTVRVVGARMRCYLWLETVKVGDEVNYLVKKQFMENILFANFTD